MKAIVVHEYGNPEVLRYEDFPDPLPKQGEVLVRVAATSINPIDYKRRSGALKEFLPIHFPGILGVDIAGTILDLGEGVQGFSPGDRVMGMADRTYAEVCVVPAANLIGIPDGLETAAAAALPLVTTTGYQLVGNGPEFEAGRTILVSGGAGSVGRCAVFAAKSRGASVIAAVLKRQLHMAETIGADQIVAADDEKALARLPLLDGVIDAVGGKSTEAMMAKIRSGGVFSTALPVPEFARRYSTVRVSPLFASPDPKALLYMAEAVRDQKLSVPVGLELPLSQAAQGHSAAEAGGKGKVLLQA